MARAEHLALSLIEGGMTQTVVLSEGGTTHIVALSEGDRTHTVALSLPGVVLVTRWV